MKLFIVESPKKCGYLKKYLGSEYEVMASFGHIRTIPPKGMNIDIKNDFTPNFEISKGRNYPEIVKKIKELAKTADEIILATDEDREGEAISWHIMELLSKKDQEKCKRVTYKEITKTAVLEALKNPRPLNVEMVEAQKARQVLDRLIGYTISPILWYSGGLKKASAGRVQSIALKFICERDKEIEAFVPEDYWFIDANLSGLDDVANTFKARVVTKDKDNKYTKEKLATEDKAALENAKYFLDKAERKEKQVNPQPPFDTATLLKTCSSMFGWGAKKTSALAQALYEKGKITYIRTDSYAISEEAIEAVRGLIKKASSDEYLPSKPNTYAQKSKAAAQEAHECIRPTDCYDKGNDLDGSEDKMYKFIRDRFIACQMAPMLVDTVAYHIKTDTKHKLIARGQTVKFEGWSKVYKYSKTKEEILPSIEKGDELKLHDLDKSKHTTQPPARYKDGTLIDKMKNEGVGRPSTYGTIPDALKKKGYAQEIPQKKGALESTPFGMSIYEYLQPNFKDFFMDVKFTALLEDDLDLIAHGDKNYLQVVGSTYETMMKEVRRLKKEGTNSNIVSTGEKCTVCSEGEIIERPGRFGKFFACNGYPECKTVYTKTEDGKFELKKKPEVKKVGRKCPECEREKRDGELLVRSNKRDGSEFIGCSKYPKCKYNESSV